MDQIFNVAKLVLFITFFVELMDPSTNFIRSRVESKTLALKVLKEKEVELICRITYKNSDISIPCENSNEPNNSRTDEVGVCYATMVKLPQFSFYELLSKFPVQFTTSFFDMYQPNIFQPPKV